MHREHDVLDFFKHLPKHQGPCFFQKHRLKIASLRIGKHRIVKKTEHRPPLTGTGYWHVVTQRDTVGTEQLFYENK